MNSPQELQALIDALRQLQRDGFAGGAALATITYTRGSTFRRAGTSMLVRGDGRIVCELAGGCPQRDIVFRANEVIATGKTQLVHYNRDANYDVLIEMGCGGELDVLIEPVLGDHDLAYLDALEYCLGKRRLGSMATVFSHDGAIQPRPRRRIDDTHRTLFDDIGDEALSSLLDEPMNALSARVERRELATPHGAVTALFERLHPRPALALIGANVGVRAMVDLALTLGWQVTVVDSDAERLLAMALPPQVVARMATPSTICELLKPDEFTAVVVMTHRYELDVEYLNALGDSSPAYVGAIGSRDRARRMNHALDGQFDQLHVPAGLDIGSDTPQEIALAVLAEIVATFNAREGRRLSVTSGPIHS
jgi:xanthine/CO dehydrogenase XdhC/CoxF family maturation factor